LWCPTFAARQLNPCCDGGSDEGRDLPLTHVGHSSDQPEFSYREAAGPHPINSADFFFISADDYKLIAVLMVGVVIDKLVHGVFSSWKRARWPPPVTTALQCVG
jgi:hypothetical protein